jgi:hypothetical protein
MIEILRPLDVGHVYSVIICISIACGDNHFSRRSLSRRRSDRVAACQADVVSLPCNGVLRRDVKIAQQALQWRSHVERAAAAQREAGIGRANAGGGDPYPGLAALGEECLAL